MPMTQDELLQCNYRIARLKRTIARLHAGPQPGEVTPDKRLKEADDLLKIQRGLEAELKAHYKETAR